MSKKKFFSIRNIISFFTSILTIAVLTVIIISPNLESDIKSDLSLYINHLNNGRISEYYDIYNTRKLTDIEKSSFYDKIKNTTKVVSSELETFKKFKLKVKVKNVSILRRVKENIYLCNVKVDYQIRENINTTKTIKKSEDYMLKIIYLGAEKGYKILLPFNSMDKDLSATNLFTCLEGIYKDNKAKEVEEQRLQDELEKESSDEDVVENYQDEHGLNSDNIVENESNNESENTVVDDGGQELNQDNNENSSDENSSNE